MPSYPSSRPLCRTKRSHEDDEADKEAHRRKRVRRNAYTGKLKKRSPEAIAAVAAELRKQDRMCVAIYSLLPSHARGLSLTATSLRPAAWLTASDASFQRGLRTYALWLCRASTLTHRLTTLSSSWLCSHRIRPADGFPIVTARDEVIERMCTSEEDHAFELELILEAYTRQAGVEMSADEVDFFFSNLESVAYNARRLATWLRAEQATGKDRVGTLFLTRVRATAASASPSPPSC